MRRIVRVNRMPGKDDATLIIKNFPSIMQHCKPSLSSLQSYTVSQKMDPRYYRL